MEKYQNKYRIASARAQWWDYGWNGAYFITICTQNRLHYFGRIAIEPRFIAAPIPEDEGRFIAASLEGDGGSIAAPPEDEGQSSIAAPPEVEGQCSIAASSEDEPRLIAALPGQWAQQIWHEIPTLFPYAELGDFVVMPDHIHGILILNKPEGPIEKTRLIASQSGDKTRLIASQSGDKTRLISSQSVDKARLIASQQRTGGITGNKNPMLNDNISRIIRWYKGRCTFEIRKTDHDFAWQARFHDHIIRDDGEYQRISDYIINNPKKWMESRDKSRLNPKRRD